MKTMRICTILGAMSASVILARGQSSFQNLDFESAMVPAGTTEGANVPIYDALPGWTTLDGSSPLFGPPMLWAVYDSIGGQGNSISLMDAAGPFAPIQGVYGVLLMGNDVPQPAVTISQSGLIPAGTTAVQFDGWWTGAAPTVAINGQALAVVPMQIFADYTVYSADVPSADAGQMGTLSFTEPAASGEDSSSSSEFFLEDVSFYPVPEPGVSVLAGCAGLLFLAARRVRR